MEKHQSDLTEAEIAGFRDMIDVTSRNHDFLMESRRNALRAHGPAGLEATDAMEAGFGEGAAALEAAVSAGSLSGYLAVVRARAQAMAGQGLEFDEIGTALMEVTSPLADLLVSEYESEPERALRAVRALHHLESEYLLAAGSSFASQREDWVSEQYMDVVRQLSTPVLDVWDEVLVMPVVGVVDSDRAQQMVAQLLERISENSARFVIMDVTGLPTVDTAVAGHLLKTTTAAKLLGAEVLLVGIRPPVAQTLVRLGASLDEISTHSDLQSGLKYALQSLGFALDRTV